MSVKVQIDVPGSRLAEFCGLHHIRKLSLFGSVLREDFRAESDVDVLVEFEQGQPVGLMGLARMERELSALLGRKVDMNTAGFISPYYRDEVMNEAEVLYVAP